jgi:acetyl-CoA C-acetyltransferase
MKGIRDRVAIIGMACTPFGERWGSSADDLLVEAATAALDSAGVEANTIDAYWLGTYASGISGLTLSRALKTDYRPVTRVENLCATGTDAFRNACYAVAASACDVAMAVGVEKLKDSGYSGLSPLWPPGDGTGSGLTDPAMFSLIVPAYRKRFGVDEQTMREVLTRIAWKNHHNGARNPRAQFRTEVSADTITCSPTVAGDLRVYDCSGVSDGAAAAIVVRSEDAHRFRDDPLYVKAVSLAAGPGASAFDSDYDYTTFPEVRRSVANAYAEAGVDDPRQAIGMAEVHDCFTPTELVLMEDLGFAEPGQSWREVLAGTFDLDGELPVNPDGGLKSFGHPIGASGLRMLFECWLQLRDEAPDDRRIPAAARERGLALTQNLGGWPGNCVSSVCLVGRDGPKP